MAFPMCLIDFRMVLIAFLLMWIAFLLVLIDFLLGLIDVLMVLNDCSVALTLERICTPSFPVWCCCKTSGRKGVWARPRGMNYFHNGFGRSCPFWTKIGCARPWCHPA